MPVLKSFLNRLLGHRSPQPKAALEKPGCRDFPAIGRYLARDLGMIDGREPVRSVSWRRDDGNR